MSTLEEHESFLTEDTEQNIEWIKRALYHTDDLVIQPLTIGGKSCRLLYIDSLISNENLMDYVIRPTKGSKIRDLEKAIQVSEVKQTETIHTIVSKLLKGSCAILVGGEAKALLASLPSQDKRAIAEPDSERVVSGSHEGFGENLSTNVMLLRRRIKAPSLKMKKYVFGKWTETDVALLYMDEIIDQEVIHNIEKKLDGVYLEDLQISTELLEAIQENKQSPFPQALTTERSDRAASYLLEGKAVLIVDGTPEVLVLPTTFFSFYQAVDDYSMHWMVGSFFRIIRLLSFFIAITLPALYIAIVTFHSEVLPLGIMYNIRTSIEFVPFPPILEALVMQLILELLKEAAIRLPSPIAQTIGIVGGLVIGTTVVEAGLVSNTMIVIIGLTAIASFAAPFNQMSVISRLLGFISMFAALFFGLFGIALILMAILIHLCKLESFGEPYFSPMSPLRVRDMKDFIIRRQNQKGTSK
ncbi:spore germination protein [Halobacillus shinanisalinarum]|uniref:Spore germination protein n=1 Tax=Halobacillus shinanisalinarum TaxID=2932258 RepID=A0ABY4H1T2_9BACI|nr:spore germination protein [Halobacillus shinanisalinarum]UOQ93875.1 spore germination protein [Halobacillus shinanisalinarum]